MATGFEKWAKGGKLGRGGRAPEIHGGSGPKRDMKSPETKGLIKSIANNIGSAHQSSERATHAAHEATDKAKGAERTAATSPWDKGARAAAGNAHRDAAEKHEKAAGLSSGAAKKEHEGMAEQHRDAQGRFAS